MSGETLAQLEEEREGVKHDKLWFTSIIKTEFGFKHTTLIVLFEIGKPYFATRTKVPSAHF